MNKENKDKNENSNKKPENANDISSSSDEDQMENIRQNNLPIYNILYPSIKDSINLDENNENNNILQINQEKSDIHYKKTISKYNLNLIEEEVEDAKSIVSKYNQDEDLILTDKFLEDLIKVPCPITKEKKISIISNFIRNSKLIKKLENEYQSDKKADLNNLSIMCAENLFYTDLKKGNILFKIGEIGNKFYIVLKGTICILKLKEIQLIKMKFFQYFNYCIKLLKEDEIYILEEVMKKNYNKIPFDSSEDLEKLCKILFQKKLYDNINRQLICNNKLLFSFFSTHEFNIEDFSLSKDELHSYELLGNYIDWKNYILKKIRLKKEETIFYEKYDSFVKSPEEMLMTCFCYEPFLYIGPGSFFGDDALEKGYIYKERRRNATIRAETDAILGWLNSIDYIDMIAPKRRMEKLKEIQFLYNNFFFHDISVHLFERNYFHLFSACEYSRGNVLFSKGIYPRALFFIKEGRISLELKSSILNIQKLIKYLYEYIFTNPLFMKLPYINQKKILNNDNEIDNIKVIKNYINEPIFKKLRGYSQSFIDELNKERKYKIAFITTNETIGLLEMFLGIPHMMKGVVSSEKISCYEIKIEHIQKIIYDEKEIIIPYIKSSINKIFSLIKRLQSIKEHYINTFMQRYENAIPNEKITNSSSGNNLIKNINININTNNDYYTLESENNESNNNIININKGNNVNLSITKFDKFNSLNSDGEIENKTFISITNNKSPLRHYMYLSPDSSKVLSNLKKNNKKNIISNNINIQLYDNKKKKKSRNHFRNYSKYEFPDIKKNNEIAKTTEHLSSKFFDINEKRANAVLIGNKCISIKNLKNKINEIDSFNNDKKNFIQIIQSTKYNNLLNNSRNINTISSNTDFSNFDTNKESILKGKQKFLNYHLSFVPLSSIKKFNESKTIYKSFNYLNIDNTNSSQKPFLSQYYENDNKKYNSLRKKINSRNLSNIITNNNTYYSNYIKTFKSLSNSKKTAANRDFNNIHNYDSNTIYNSYDNNMNGKIKGHIHQKIKDFYKEIKSKGILSIISNAENNTFFKRKFNKKYVNAIKTSKNYKYKDKSIGVNLKKTLPEIKDIKNSN